MAYLQGCRCMHVRTVPPGRYLSSPGCLNLQKRLLAGAQSVVKRVRSAASATPGLTLASFILTRIQPDCVVALFQSTHKCMGPSGCWPDWTCVCSGHRAAGPGSAAEEGWHVPGPAQPGWRGLWHGRFGVCAMAALGRLCWCGCMLKGNLLMWAAIGHACMPIQHICDSALCLCFIAEAVFIFIKLMRTWQLRRQALHMRKHAPCLLCGHARC